MIRRDDEQLERDNTPASWLSITTVVAVPAVVLASIWQIADAKQPPPDTPATTIAPNEEAGELTTDLLSMRRHPTPIATEIAQRSAAQALAAEIEEITTSIGGESCFTMVDPEVIPSVSGDQTASQAETIIEINPDRFVIPASNQKLYVAAVALDILGSDYRFKTELLSTPPVNGTIAGPVFLVGGGDPVLTTTGWQDPQRYDAFNTTNVDSLADQLVALGVTKIEGALAGVASRYDTQTRSDAWSDDITTFDVAPIAALMINDANFGTSGVIPNPAQAAVQTFVEVLRAKGIEVTEGARSDLDPNTVPGLQSVASVESATLDKVLIELLHTSDNTTAEMLVKEIGLTAAGSGDWGSGLSTILKTLTDWGIDTTNLTLADGSGLSRNNATRCGQLVELLQRSPVADQLIGLLPVAGRDGTLSDNFIGTPAEGKMQAKTGTLTGVAALSGVTRDRNDDPLLFSLILNGVSKDPADLERLWGELAALGASYPTTASVDVEAVLPLP